MTEIPAGKVELFINEYLKEDLKRLENYIKVYNEEIMEFVQLKNTIQTMRGNFTEGFKTQMNIGGSTFMEAKVDCLDKILVDIGKSCFVEFTLEEAIKFLNFKIAILSKECQVVRDESVKTRSDIKMALVYMAGKEKMNVNIS